LAEYEDGNFEAALKEWRPLAEQGNASAQTNLGYMFRTGKGVPQDFSEALNWYQLAAVQGDATAQFNLGLAYSTGEGLPQDFVAAYMWYNMSSAEGNKNAAARQDNLAGKMLPADVSVAQKRARVCMESNYQDCD
jgi:hypothetical protein